MSAMDAKTLAATLMALPGFGRQRVIELLHLSGDHWPEIQRLHDILDWIGTRHRELHLRTLWTNEQVASALHRAETIRELCWKLNLTMTIIGEKDYPKRLMQIPNPPVILYARGSRECLTAPIIAAVIGTREPTKFGKWTAIRLSEELGRCGIVVVSGLAIGCDTFAHEGCLMGRGQTVAVLAHGLDRIYPAQNRGLAEEIVDTGGCLVSEYPPGAPAFKNQFVDRDRLQIGLSDVLILIESDVQGGSMHTVRFSKEQGKPIGAIAHPDQYLSEYKTKGNQALILAGDAWPIRDRESLANLIAKLTASSGRESAKLIKTREQNQDLFSENSEDSATEETS
jgi:DNA processing protein